MFIMLKGAVDSTLRLVYSDTKDGENKLFSVFLCVPVHFGLLNGLLSIQIK